MKNLFLTSLLVTTPFLLTGCVETTTAPSPATPAATTEAKKTLNDYMLVFQTKMEAYVVTTEKDLKALEQLHQNFVPILNWPEFTGDDTYKAAALSVGSIVHKMEDASGEEYSQLLASLKPAFEVFYAQYQ